VLNIVVTCSAPERMGPNGAGKDDTRDEIWPIIGGRFEGRDIRGTAMALARGENENDRLTQVHRVM
jgi:hypothetical protein